MGAKGGVGVGGGSSEQQQVCRTAHRQISQDEREKHKVRNDR